VEGDGWFCFFTNRHLTQDKKYTIKRYLKKQVFIRLKLLETYIKPIRVQVWKGPEVSRRLRLPDFKQSENKNGKVFSPTTRHYLPPRKYSWFSLLLEAESNPGP
jgi:hypothetical protein